jgi:hypothetical protein
MDWNDALEEAMDALKMGQLHWGRQIGIGTYLLPYYLITCMGKQNLGNLD